MNILDKLNCNKIIYNDTKKMIRNLNQYLDMCLLSFLDYYLDYFFTFHKKLKDFNNL